MSPHAARPALLLVLLAALCGLPACGDGAEETLANPAEEAIEHDPYADAGPTRIRFRDVTARAGIRTPNHSGRPGLKEFLFEAVGPGAAWFDYDGDGLLDVYIPDGDVLANYDLGTAEDPATRRRRAVLQRKADPVATHLDQLWRNNGDGTFTDVAERAGIREARWSFGATAFDYDADGDTDVFVANFGPNTLWRNNGDGTFTDIAASVGLEGPAWAWNTCAAVGDVDDDGRLDLYVAAYSDPAAEIERLRRKQKLAPGVAIDKIGGRDCRWRGIPAYCGPIGLKGQHDTLYRQKEDGTFEDMTDVWGVRPPVPKYAFTCLMFDFDEDGLLDIYVANDSEENFMWHQERDGQGRILFRDQADTLGIKVGSQVTAQASMGMDVADVDGDGRLDITVTNFSHDFNNLYISKRAPGGGQVYFKDRGMQTMGQQVYYDLAWGCGWYDFENDGDLDLYVANGHVYKEIDLFEKTGANYYQLNALFECMEDHRLGFREVGAKAQRHATAGARSEDLYAGDGMEVELCSRQAAFADFNNDGRMDVLVQNMNEPPTVLLNESLAAPDGSNWIKLGLRQPGGNRDALGAIVEVRYPTPVGSKSRKLAVVRQKSFLGCDDPRLHVGVAGADRCDVTVTWPGAERARSVFQGLEVGRHWLLDRETGEAVALELRAFDLK